VSRRVKRDLAASVLARLLQRARQSGDDYQTLLAAFAYERFLYRLSVSRERDRFVLKGAMLLRVWSDQPYRATRDLDLLRRGVDSNDVVRGEFVEIFATPTEADGLEFDLASIRLETLRADEEYVGTRVQVVAQCGQARIPMQIDVGTGDAVWPRAVRQAYPALLEFPAPEVLAYPPEAVIAEKVEAMVVLGDRNSRIKDFFDLQYLARRFAFDRAPLVEAIRKTFSRRQTPVPIEPLGLTAFYWENPARPPQIRAFAKRAGLVTSDDPGADILSTLRPFLLPVLADVRDGKPGVGHWPAGGPWS
jgi:Nucleotidyl transferase AbiEii toxin, Type IV TA system